MSKINKAGFEKLWKQMLKTVGRKSEACYKDSTLGGSSKFAFKSGYMNGYKQCLHEVILLGQDKIQQDQQPQQKQPQTPPQT